MNLLDNVYRFASCVRIAHHIPGRIRLRLALEQPLPALGGEEPSLLALAGNFKEVLDNIAGVRSIRVNLVARSCAIEYDHHVIPYNAWPDFLEGRWSDEAHVLKRIIEDKCAEVAGA